ncbi:Hypothetical Protein FCC1311_012122 [Hondaea fermentalgiana]|uniref:Uncharacterized protein n=1 Tax=Hondaea fermentalgiana TaxID=2315210 RepID=A0A2R5G385_9STRA|nr:Hypothetical Protein FCC1311_012122 [Hondaea fermentalgiana]|eukprot:GBG24995.1 Hypothetical Protein FCC1311_012122 [Hondaea fermentalgiana]
MESKEHEDAAADASSQGDPNAGTDNARLEGQELDDDDNDDFDDGDDEAKRQQDTDDDEDHKQGQGEGKRTSAQESNAFLAISDPERRYLDDKATDLVRDCKYLAPRTAPTRLIAVAPAIEAHISKRDGAFGAQSNDLDKKREFLRQQALEKERQFKTNVSHLRTRIEAFRERLGEEVERRDDEYNHTKTNFEATLERARVLVDEEIDASVAVVEEDWLPPPERRLDAWKADFDHFVHVTVPETIENQSGRVTRHLIKAQETFEIDNAKLLKRESKIEQRFESHVVNAARNMSEAIRKRKDCFTRLETDMEAAETEAIASTDRHEEHCDARIVEVEDLQSGLAGIRSKADSQLLIAIEEAMLRLQNSVLTNFGSQQQEASLTTN